MKDQPNILFVVLDTLRKDVMNQYGGHANTPNIDGLAKDGVVYKNPIATAAWTMPSHASIFTGLLPSEHGVHEAAILDPFDIIERNRENTYPMLQEMLKSKGYMTRCISNNVWISEGTGFDRGFDNITYIDITPKWISEAFNQAQKYGDSIQKVITGLVKEGNIKGMHTYAKAWIGKKVLDMRTNYPLDKGFKLTADMVEQMDWKRKTFLFINTVEIHEPYVGETEKERWTSFMGLKKMDDKRAAEIKLKYIDELEYCDMQLGRIIADLKKKKAYDNTMIIVTSDHGQAFNEHGFMYHGTYTYDEITNVPLIIKYPGNKKYKERKGYQCITNFFRFFEQILDGGDDSALTTNTAFSESYGFTHVLPPRYKHMKDRIDKTLLCERRSIYKDGYKLTFNVTTNKIEEFELNGKSVDQTKNKALVKDLKAALMLP